MVCQRCVGNLEESRRTPSGWARTYFDSYIRKYVFAPERGEQHTPLVLVLRENINQWSVRFVIKKDQYLKNTEHCFNNLKDAISFAHKLMVEFNLGKLDDYQVIKVDGSRGDETIWSSMKTMRDSRLGLNRRYVW